MRISELQEIKRRYNIVGNCDALNHALDVALQVAPTDLSVLIVGESGVGKEIIPRLIHERSPRRREKYFAINCGSIPEGTIDSELFGHVKGSFTGAIDDSPGYFGAANKGTLFLDEVGELPLATQARLLRVLETGEYISVGATEVRKTDVRIVAATNVNMTKAISEGRFREDLYYRLNSIPIHMPPLRERGEDIVLLFRLFAMQMAEKYKMERIVLDDGAKEILKRYKWPGNVKTVEKVVFGERGKGGVCGSVVMSCCGAGSAVRFGHEAFFNAFSHLAHLQNSSGLIETACHGFVELFSAHGNHFLKIFCLEEEQCGKGEANQSGDDPNRGLFHEHKIKPPAKGGGSSLFEF